MVCAEHRHHAQDHARHGRRAEREHAKRDEGDLAPAALRVRAKRARLRASRRLRHLPGRDGSAGHCLPRLRPSLALGGLGGIRARSLPWLPGGVRGRHGLRQVLRLVRGLVGDRPLRVRHGTEVCSALRAEARSRLDLGAAVSAEHIASSSWPGFKCSARQVQATARMLHDVRREHGVVHPIHHVVRTGERSVRVCPQRCGHVDQALVG